MVVLFQLKSEVSQAVNEVSGPDQLFGAGRLDMRPRGIQSTRELDYLDPLGSRLDPFPP